MSSLSSDVPLVSSSDDANVRDPSLPSSSSCSSSSANNNDGDCHSISSCEAVRENGHSPSREMCKNGDNRMYTVKILRRPPAVSATVLNHHDCSSLCTNESKRIETIKGVKVLTHCILINRVNPYCVPIFLGWHRAKSDGWVVYTAPCGKQLNSLRQVYQYLLRTDSGLSIDQFSFYSQLKLHTTRDPFKANIYVADITNGKECFPIPCINEIDSCSPVGEFTYISKSIAGPNVNLDCDPEFLSSCACQDQCKNSDDCSCHGLSKDEAYMISGLDSVNQAGYKYKCLNKKLVSAVFECNDNCKCGSRCLNRVAQNEIKHCLQVFKTLNRGWGVRCLHDIPPGSFICLYAGEIIDFDTVNETDRINDYIAALDYIDEGRRPKRDFDTASDIDSVLDSDTSSSEELSSCEGISNSSIIDDLSDNDADITESDAAISNGGEPNHHNGPESVQLDDSPNSCKMLSSDSSKRSHEMEDNCVDDISKRTRNENGHGIGNGNGFQNGNVPVIDLEEELINEVLTSHDLDTDDVIIDFDSMDQSKISSSREGTNGDTIASNHDINDIDEINGDDEESKSNVILKHLDMAHSFSVDGARFGNVGRFLNHSCEPNCRIRNVFINNHDYRFPHLAFFSTKLIKAYDELTWDYRYPPDIPYSDSKECLCGARLCRGRIY